MLNSHSCSNPFILAISFLVIFNVNAKAAESDGKTLYVKNCQMCHAADGKGNPKIATSMKVDLALLNLVDEETSKKTDANLTKTVQDGKGKMKGFKDKLNKEEVAAILKYIRLLGK